MKVADAKQGNGFGRVTSLAEPLSPIPRFSMIVYRMEGLACSMYSAYRHSSALVSSVPIRLYSCTL